MFAYLINTPLLPMRFKRTPNSSPSLKTVLVHQMVPTSILMSSLWTALATVTKKVKSHKMFVLRHCLAYSLSMFCQDGKVVLLTAVCLRLLMVLVSLSAMRVGQCKQSVHNPYFLLSVNLSEFYFSPQDYKELFNLQYSQAQNILLVCRRNGSRSPFMLQNTRSALRLSLSKV